MFIIRFFYIFPNEYKFIFLLFFTLFIKQLSQEILEIENSQFPMTLTLSNGNILFVSNVSITFYNSYFNSSIKSYNLKEEEIFQNKEESSKIIIRQYPNNYIIIWIKGKFKIFSQEGELQLEKNLSNLYNSLSQFDLIPIKIVDTDLYYIIAYTNRNNFTINIRYYSININSQNLIEINNKVFNLKDFIKNDDYVSQITNIECELMSNETYNNQLICFYGSQYPSKIHSTSFDIDNDLSPINNFYYYSSSNLNYIKSICQENKLQTLICFFQLSAQVYCSIYDLEKNNITEPKKYISFIGSDYIDLGLYYFKIVEQYIVFSRGNDSRFHLFFFNKNFEEIFTEELEIEFGGNYYLSNRGSIIYLQQNEKYFVLSDSQSNDYKSCIRLFPTNITSDILNSYSNNNNINDAESSIIVSDSIKENLSYNNNINDVESSIIVSDSIKENLSYNKTLKCNKSEGYYPVNYNLKNKIKDYYYVECFNNETKPINFYFNKEKEEYDLCYETCRTCNYKGNATINNCTTCDFDSVFRPEENSTNCVKECRYRYYITPYGQYKCTKDKECTSVASLYIKYKDKCISDCSLDDTYIYQYNGECFDECPENTIAENNICVYINKETCSIDLNEYDIENNLTTDNLDLIAKTYAKEYYYTNNHISIFQHELYLITMYKNKDCITNLGLSAPKIDFGNCINIVKQNYHIKKDLIVLIIEKYFNGNSEILYSLYNPEGEKLDTTKLCSKENVTIEQNIISALNSTNINIDNLLKLTKQNINIFDELSDFYNDICFHFESPNGKDITLQDRILDYYPNITLCNEECFCEGVNLTSMMALCQCKFTDILSGNIFKENAFISKISEDIIEIISMSNLEILKCYKDAFSYKYFIKNIGGFIIIGIIFFQTIFVIIFICRSMNGIRKYSFGLIEIYLRYINPKYSIKYKEYISDVIKQNPPIKHRGTKKYSDKIKNPKRLSSSKKIIKFENENDDNESKYFSLFSHLSMKTNKKKHKTLQQLQQYSRSNLDINNKRKNANSLTIRSKNKYKNLDLDNKINEYMKEYLSTDEDDMDYDDAIKKDKRKFFNFFWSRVKVNTWIINIIFSNEKLKPRSIKLLLFILNVDLYFVVNGFFFNEKYISEVYHSNKEEKFFDFVTRTNYNFFYASMVGALIEYMIKCFFVEERKFQNLFRREKDNEIKLRAEFGLILNLIKSRYIAFFVTSYVITLLSWYYVTCFNNVYPNMKIEWIKSSITIIIIMILVYVGLALLETILRFLSFRCKSEKLFKFSKIFADCC